MLAAVTNGKFFTIFLNDEYFQSSKADANFVLVCQRKYCDNMKPLQKNLNNCSFYNDIE